MSELAWDGIIGSVLGERDVKPRTRGVNMVIDLGFGLRATEDILELSARVIDHWKWGFGTSVFVETDLVRRKNRMLAEQGILVYPGGTLLEVALLTHHCRVYMRHAKELGFGAVEISDGTIPLPRFRRQRMIACAADAGLIPLTEVGKKDPKRQPTAAEIAEQALQDLEWGAHWVVIEGRESGIGVGVYDEDGNVEASAVAEVRQAMGSRADRLIWEAPLKKQQAFLIEAMGPNVGLGNLPPDKVLAVEALRAGLRFETLHAVSEGLVRSGAWDPARVEQPDAQALIRTAGIER